MYGEIDTGGPSITRRDGSVEDTISSLSSQDQDVTCSQDTISSLGRLFSEYHIALDASIIVDPKSPGLLTEALALSWDFSLTLTLTLTRTIDGGFGTLMGLDLAYSSAHIQGL